MSLWHAAASSDTREEPRDHDISALLEMLGRLADPRSPQGKRHELVFTLACAVVAVLAGACNYRQLGSQVADIPQSLLARLGAKWNRFKRWCDWPSEPTLRRVLQDIDADELDLLIGAWLFERARRGPDGLLVIALDGKVLRGAWTDENDQVTLFSALVHGQGVTVAQVRVPDGTNEITQVEPLLAGLAPGAGQQVVVTVDAAHPGTSSRNAATGGLPAGPPGLPTPTESTFPTPRRSAASAATSAPSTARLSARNTRSSSPAAPPAGSAPPTCTPTSASTGESRTRAITCATRPGGRTTTRPTSETGRIPWRLSETWPSDYSG